MTICICEMELPTGEAVTLEWDKHEGHLVKHMDGERTLQKRSYPDRVRALQGFARMAGKLFLEQCADERGGHEQDASCDHALLSDCTRSA